MERTGREKETSEALWSAWGHYDVHWGQHDPSLACTKEAKADTDVGELIAPTDLGGISFPKDGGVVHEQGFLVTTMKFDIAVSAETKGEGSGGVGMGIKAVSAKLSGAVSSRDERVSRTQFAVPFKFPGY